MLAAELVASARTLNPETYRYGRFRLWGDLSRSRYFSIAGQRDITPLLRVLSIRPSAEPIGRAFQGPAAVRPISPADHGMLAAYAATLALEPRARLAPEDALEAAIVSGDPSRVYALLRPEACGVAEARREYLSHRAPERSHELTTLLRRTYGGRCQICEWDPRNRYGQELCEGHHVRWLSRGGEDELPNVVLLCPNHHRSVHRCDAPFDWADGAFVFASVREVLSLRLHQLAAC